MFGLGVNRLGATNQKPFSPASLFNNGEAGVWYDPSAASGSLDWRRNLLQYTESFDNNYWNRATSDSTAVPVVTANQAMAPDGTQTADLINLTAPADNQWALVRRVSLVTVNRAPKIQQSVWLKAYDSAQVGKKLNAYIYDFNVGYKTVGVITLTSEWQRFIVSHVFSSGAQTIEVSFGKARNTAGGITQAETATQFYIWGAQLEEASTASSYQPILSTFESAFKAAFPSHTLYQDSNGTTPVTAVGEPVGLMLDKSEGLAQGPEQVTNGDFATDSGWIKGTNWSISGGKANCTGGSSQFLYVTPTVTDEGQRITIEVTVTDYTSGALYISFSTGGEDLTTAMTSTGTYTFSGMISGNAAWYLRGVNFVGSIDNVSVKEVAGSHATQATSTKRPIYARHPEGGIRNLLNYTEQFDNGYWSKLDGSSVTVNAGVAPNGTQTADRLSFSTSVLSRVEKSLLGLGANVTVTYSVWLKSESGTQNLQIGTSGTSKTSVTATTEWQRFTHTTTDADGNVYPRVENSDDGVARSVLAWGAQLEEATEASNYQKRVTDIDVTESGVGEVYYLKFDGVDDGMFINNLTSGNTPITSLFGYSATNAESATSKYLLDIQSGRTVFAASAVAPAGRIGYWDGSWRAFDADADSIKVLTYDLVEDNAKIRIDGTQEYSDTTYDQQAIGGTIKLFTAIDHDAQCVGGNMYQTILRAAESTDEEIAKAETYVANKTGLKAQVDGIATLDLNFGNNTYTAKNSNGGVI